MKDLAGLDLDQLVGIGQPPEDPAQRPEQLVEPRRAVDRDRHLAPAQRERLEHPGQPQVVVRVVVREENLAQLDQPDVGAEQLPLRPLRAIEEQPLAPTPDQERRGRPLRRRHRAGRAEEDQIEVHARSLGPSSLERGTPAAGIGTDKAPAVMSQPSLTERVTRSLTLLRVFVVASAVLLALAAAVLGTILTHALRDQALEDAKVDLTQYTNGVLNSELLRDSKLVIRRRLPEVIDRDLSARPDIVSVKVWRADGVLAWTNVAPERIGKRFPAGHHLEEVVETGQAEAEFEELGEAEDAAEAGLGFDNVVEVYAPIRAGRKVVGAYEIYANSSTIEHSIANGKRTIWFATFAVLAVVWALLLVLVRGASTTLTGQTEKLRARSRQLMESYKRLEENTLEAIETLNATVEAKDPYTAGHSHRVQEIALSVGRQLGLEPARLEALRLAGLFHDIGKLAVPDAILTKPARLTPDEFAVIQEHSEAGARIVGKLGRLRDAVPIIRHHHERWDGHGYPQRLAGETIPLEAAIVGLADAWDAMTTDRPYHRALSVQEAIEEIRTGRGTQFAPQVVDAFLATLKQGTILQLARDAEPGEALEAAG